MLLTWIVLLNLQIWFSSCRASSCNPVASSLVRHAQYAMLLPSTPEYARQVGRANIVFIYADDMTRIGFCKGSRHAEGAIGEAVIVEVSMRVASRSRHTSEGSRDAREMRKSRGDSSSAALCDLIFVLPLMTHAYCPFARVSARHCNDLSLKRAHQLLFSTWILTSNHVAFEFWEERGTFARHLMLSAVGEAIRSGWRAGKEWGEQGANMALRDRSRSGRRTDDAEC